MKFCNYLISLSGYNLCIEQFFSVIPRTCLSMQNYIGFPFYFCSAVKWGVLKLVTLKKSRNVPSILGL